MKFKFTIQPYQTEAVESVVNIFAGQPFNDRWTYRRDVAAVKEPVKAEDEAIERNLENWRLTDEELKAKKRLKEQEQQREQEELAIGFANAKVQLDKPQLLENIHRMQANLYRRQANRRRTHPKGEHERFPRSRSNSAPPRRGHPIPGLARQEH